jgi:hypothetical protein
MEDNVPLLNLDLKNLEDSIFENEDIIFRRMVECIDYGINTGVDIVTLFTVPPMDGDNIYLVLKEMSWITSLEKCLSYFEGIEDYEMCEYTKDVLERINNN